MTRIFDGELVGPVFGADRHLLAGMDHGRHLIVRRLLNLRVLDCWIARWSGIPAYAWPISIERTITSSLPGGRTTKG